MYECINLAIHGEIVFPEWILNLIHFNHFALVINSSTNILIYCWRDKKFLNVMLITCRIRSKDALLTTVLTRAASGRRTRFREDESNRNLNGNGNSANGTGPRHVQIELIPAESKKYQLQPDVEKKEEVRISVIPFQGHGLEPGTAKSTNQNQNQGHEGEEEESCNCCCGYNSESQSCCSNPDEVIAKCGKASAATQIPSAD